ncbi:hypothetical protein BU24DRAFT_478641 [Aaosphaeria arxii CBS 175.79]|uniref:Uncharacterized protein n=1 Tax=Aaosphaeria arxii CBS 175.79 TaxID=1450172 RepID=A0A6A5XXJ0_9PLEO|nr:uncharacterized protein BU24DRAFT_478641 [Aaosphaeria arxii CBS 175.79]KAF2017537.1 hypothetical protein BU24DRAFT_478641 [Aaosphaeria arxii CBS 175.79]
MSHSFDIQSIYDAKFGKGVFSRTIDPFTKNLRTESIMARKHHCTLCGDKAPTARCYQADKLHYAFCIAEDATGVACGERFQVESPKGCGTHHYSHGYNECFKIAYKSLRSGHSLNGSVSSGENDDCSDITNNEVIEHHDYTYYETTKRQRTWEAKDTKTGREKTRKTKKLQPAPTISSYTKKLLRR